MSMDDEMLRLDKIKAFISIIKRLKMRLYERERSRRRGRDPVEVAKRKEQNANNPTFKQRRKETCKRYYLKHKERIDKRTTEWNKQNEERLILYRKSKRDERKQYVQENREYFLMYKKIYREQNKDKINAYKKRPHVRVHDSIRNNILRHLKNKNRKKSFDLLGFTIGDLMEHLEKLFKPGMTWENYGKWEIDHILPLSKFSIRSENSPDFQIAWDIHNQPLWKAENMSKGNKIPEIIMPNRFMMITDVHYGATPATRKDNYNVSILSKLAYVFKIASQNQCDIICSGDLFDTPKLKYMELIPLAKLFQEYKDVVKFYCINGNEGHDGLPDISPLTFFKMAGLIEPSELYADFEHVRLIFAGHGTNIESMNQLFEPSKVNIMMTHMTLVTEPTIFEHILIEDFRTRCQVVTVGHYHAEQGIIERQDGTIFIAPGAITRRKKTKENIGRIPKMCFISVENGNIKTKLLSIPCNEDIWVEKSELEVSDEVYYDTMKKEVVNLKSLVDTTDIVGLSLEESLKKYFEQYASKASSEDKVAPEVLKYVFKQLNLTIYV